VSDPVSVVHRRLNIASRFLALVRPKSSLAFSSLGVFFFYSAVSDPSATCAATQSPGRVLDARSTFSLIVSLSCELHLADAFFEKWEGKSGPESMVNQDLLRCHAPLGGFLGRQLVSVPDIRA